TAAVRNPLRTVVILLTSFDQRQQVVGQLLDAIRFYAHCKMRRSRNTTQLIVLRALLVPSGQNENGIGAEPRDRSQLPDGIFLHDMVETPIGHNGIEWLGGVADKQAFGSHEAGGVESA